MTHRLTLLLSVLLLAAIAVPAQAQRPLAPEDVYHLKAVSDPQLSPDGKLVAYVVTIVDAAKNRRVASIWEVPADGSAEAKPLIAAVPARSPRWSPDGKWLAFISNAAAPDKSSEEKTAAAGKAAPAPKNQVWVTARDGSDQRRITHFANGVSRFNWSPDGTHLAVVARTGDRTGDVKHYLSMAYKSDDEGWSTGGRSHIWVVDVKDGAARQLTTDANRDDSDPQWSPNGQWLAYVSNDVGPDVHEVNANSGVLVIPVTGGEPRTICEEHAYVSSPRWSPDSKQLAYASAPTFADQQLLWITTWADPSRSVLASDTDLFPTEIEWDANGLWFGAHVHGDASLFRVDLATHHAAVVRGGDRAFRELRISEAAHKLVYLADDPAHPDEVFSSELDGSHERQLTFHNRELLSEVSLSQMERLSWKSADGLTIEGFFLRPAGWQAGRKYPMILNIHGGPNGMFGFHWSMDEQVYASNGYAVLMTNPRGSSGYGTKFQRAVAGEWGGKAYQDIINGVEATLVRNPWVDRDHLGVVGHSYGGFMTDWVVTQTNMFKAAIAISGIADFISVEGTRDGAYGHSRDFGGDLFTSFDTFWKYSAVRLASKVKTPILLLHGEVDNRVPVSQAEEYFRAIKHFGGTAELVIFPRENHMLPVSAEPKHLVETYQWRLYWFDRFVKGNAKALPPDASGETAGN
jgi:dipeptidyl aminopeptidase/acylaminoacyl peptidase